MLVTEGLIELDTLMMTRRTNSTKRPYILNLSWNTCGQKCQMGGDSSESMKGRGAGVCNPPTCKLSLYHFECGVMEKSANDVSLHP